ncbi:hypothetical protein O181_010868 [Austropuccinia psidii MF-1]|uniref:Uncharacterized protein n=1 Tax=Austropuccinia psidii MF-1 TaxID=1389203 RepID=A0A9Q3BTU8_9BASI|nr:hypothetical protein [Austropuccinia psidii MF-1]
MAETNQLQKEKELKLPQEASVDIKKASQKAYNNALKHKEYQISADLWKNCVNSYLTVRKFLGHPNTCKLLNQWHPLMEKKHDAFDRRMEEKQPSTTQAMPKPAPIARSRNPNGKKKTKVQNKGKGKAPAKNLTARVTESQRFSRMQSKIYFRWPEQ